MNVFVTGGAGYLGTTLVPLLLDRGHSVVVFDSFKTSTVPILPFFRNPRFSFVRGDIREKGPLTEAARSADAFVHLAAIVGYPACHRSPEEARSVNVQGTRNVAAAAGRDRPVVFASTSSCYGAVEDALCTEDTPLRPLSLYGETKVEGEEVVRSECNATVYRIATAYGLSPRLRLDLLVNDFVYLALHDRRLRVYEGQYRRSFIHVHDVARAIVLALDKTPEMAGRVFNVGDEVQNLTKLEVCQVIAEILGDVAIETCADGKDADQRDYAVSYARIHSQGFRASISLEAGICELAAALRWIDPDERQHLRVMTAGDALSYKH
jgi:nucleoside-diphosphate-sugar epimerase